MSTPMTGPSPSALQRLLDLHRLPPSIERTIASVYEPLADHIATVPRTRQPYVVGVCGPQGSGKSTLTAILRELLSARGLSTVVLSLDDLYLTRSERQQLAERTHPLLLTRGVPGTHDVALGIRLLNAFGGTGQVTLPSFDKSTDDRRPDLACLQAPVDIVLFEGWFVGATPQSERALENPVNELERLEDPHGTWRRFVNDALRDRYQHLFDWIDALVMLQARDFDVVHRWRSEQESKLRERVKEEGRSAPGLMDENALRRFVAHYERLTRHVLEEMPSRADIVIELDDARVPTRVLGLPASTPASQHP